MAVRTDSPSNSQQLNQSTLPDYEEVCEGRHVPDANSFPQSLVLCGLRMELCRQGKGNRGSAHQNRYVSRDLGSKGQRSFHAPTVAGVEGWGPFPLTGSLAWVSWTQFVLSHFYATLPRSIVFVLPACSLRHSQCCFFMGHLWRPF